MNKEINKIRVTILGGLGRMGKSNITEVFKNDALKLESIIETKEHPSLGTSISSIINEVDIPISISNNLAMALSNSDVVIDFTSPESTLDALKTNLKFKKAFVIGTTGFTPTQLKTIDEMSQHFPIVLSANFSLGVNILFASVSQLAKLLNKDLNYDIEIIESHHRFKKDAPSGTAMQLAKLAAQHSGRNAEKDLKFGRHGLIGERSLDEIGISTLRQGGIVGEHTIQFTTFGEQLHIGHRAFSRQAFSKGAVLAAQWIVQHQTGLFSMQDILNLNSK